MGLEDGLEGRKRAGEVQRTFRYWELKWSEIDILRRTASRFNSLLYNPRVRNLYAPKS